MRLGSRVPWILGRLYYNEKHIDLMHWDKLEAHQKDFIYYYFMVFSLKQKSMQEICRVIGHVIEEDPSLFFHQKIFRLNFC